MVVGGRKSYVAVATTSLSDLRQLWSVANPSGANGDQIPSAATPTAPWFGLYDSGYVDGDASVAMYGINGSAGATFPMPVADSQTGNTPTLLAIGPGRQLIVSQNDIDDDQATLTAYQLP